MTTKVEKNSIKEHLNKSNVLKKVDTLGHFDFSTYLITLEVIDQEDMSGISSFDKSSISDHEFINLMKLFPLAIHEYTHFLDSTSTIWGIGYLYKMYEAYASEGTMDEKQFYKAKYFHDYSKAIFLSDYYTVIGNADESRPWQFQLTIGRQFDNEGKVSKIPILFLTFTNFNGEFLARSPLSTASVLEASAMAQEIDTSRKLIAKTDASTRHFKYGSFDSKTMSFFYNKKITEYSTCIHLVTTYFQITDIFNAFEICNILTGVVLNFPSSAFEQVLSSYDFEGQLKGEISEDSIAAIKDGIQAKNLGILFLLLLMATKKPLINNKYQYKRSIKAAIEKITSWSLSKVIQESENEFMSTAKTLAASDNESVKLFANAGLGNYKKMSFFRESLNFNLLDLPPFYDKDGVQQSIFNSIENGLRKLNIEDVFTELVKGESWVRRFNSACL